MKSLAVGMHGTNTKSKVSFVMTRLDRLHCRRLCPPRKTAAILLCVCVNVYVPWAAQRRRARQSDESSGASVPQQAAWSAAHRFELERPHGAQRQRRQAEGVSADLQREAVLGLGFLLAEGGRHGRPRLRNDKALRAQRRVIGGGAALVLVAPDDDIEPVGKELGPHAAGLVAWIGLVVLHAVLVQHKHVEPVCRALRRPQPLDLARDLERPRKPLLPHEAESVQSDLRVSLHACVR